MLKIIFYIVIGYTAATFAGIAQAERLGTFTIPGCSGTAPIGVGDVHENMAEPTSGDHQGLVSALTRGERSIARPRRPENDGVERPARLWIGDGAIGRVRSTVEVRRRYMNSKDSNPADLMITLEPFERQELDQFMKLLVVAEALLFEMYPDYKPAFEIRMNRPDFKSNAPTVTLRAENTNRALEVMEIMRRIQTEHSDLSVFFNKRLDPLTKKIVERLADYRMQKIINKVIADHQPRYSESGQLMSAPREFSTSKKGFERGSLEAKLNAVYKHVSYSDTNAGGLLNERGPNGEIYRPIEDPFVTMMIESMGGTVPQP